MLLCWPLSFSKSKDKNYWISHVSDHSTGLQQVVSKSHSKCWKPSKKLYNETLLCAHIFIYHRFLLFVFYTFPQTQTFNSKQRQHHITVKKQTKTQRDSDWFLFAFSSVILILLFLHIHNSWRKYFKYWCTKQTVKS